MLDLLLFLLASEMAVAKRTNSRERMLRSGEAANQCLDYLPFILVAIILILVFV